MDEVKSQDTMRRAQETTRWAQETGQRAHEALHGALEGGAADTPLWSDASRRAMDRLVDLTADGVRESTRLGMRMQRLALDALAETQAAALRWQMMWPEAFRDPLRWQQRSMEEMVEHSRRSLRVVGGAMQEMSASLERVAASAEEAGRSVQEAFGEMASRMNERHAA